MKNKLHLKKEKITNRFRENKEIFLNNSENKKKDSEKKLEKLQLKREQKDASDTFKMRQIKNKEKSTKTKKKNKTKLKLKCL